MVKWPSIRKKSKGKARQEGFREEDLAVHEPRFTRTPPVAKTPSERSVLTGSSSRTQGRSYNVSYADTISTSQRTTPDASTGKGMASGPLPESETIIFEDLTKYDRMTFPTFTSVEMTIAELQAIEIHEKAACDAISAKVQARRRIINHLVSRMQRQALRITQGQVASELGRGGAPKERK